MSDVTNEDRASFAEGALDEYTRKHYNGRSFAEMKAAGGDHEMALQDLLCDLRHLATREGLDFGGINTSAEFHYDAEVAESIDGLKLPNQRNDTLAKPSSALNKFP